MIQEFINFYLFFFFPYWSKFVRFEDDLCAFCNIVEKEISRRKFLHNTMEYY